MIRPASRGYLVIFNLPSMKFILVMWAGQTISISALKQILSLE